MKEDIESRLAQQLLVILVVFDHLVALRLVEMDFRIVIVDEERLNIVCHVEGEDAITLLKGANVELVLALLVQQAMAVHLLQLNLTLVDVAVGKLYQPITRWPRSLK